MLRPPARDSSMPIRAFISYSHADEKALERLHKHLAVLQREDLLAAWYDHAILPGENLGQTINAELDRSDLFLALLSPDYLASKYCYEKEFQHALDLAKEGRLRIVAIVVEPCDWLSTQFSQLMALPKDGKPVSEWMNANNAYLDVASGIRRLIEDPATAADRGDGEEARDARFAAAARRIRLKRDFDAIQRAEFADEAYAAIEDYFRTASSELSEASEELRTRFEVMSSTAFTCSLVNRASRRNGEAHITVHNGKGHRGGFGDISYVYERYADTGTSNGSIRVDADEYNLFLVTDSFGGGGGRDASKQSPRQAAEWLWSQFVQRAGVEYE